MRGQKKKQHQKISESKPEEFTVCVTTASIIQDFPAAGTNYPSVNLQRILHIITVCNISERIQKTELSTAELCSTVGNNYFKLLKYFQIRIILSLFKIF